MLLFFCWLWLEQQEDHVDNAYSQLTWAYFPFITLLLGKWLCVLLLLHVDVHVRVMIDDWDGLDPSRVFQWRWQEGEEEIKVILIDCYRHSHLFPLEFPLFPACVHALARLLCLTRCLCFCMCAWALHLLPCGCGAKCQRVCICAVCLNTSATCGNLIIWKWNMCSCLCLSSPASSRPFFNYFFKALFSVRHTLTALISLVDQVALLDACQLLPVLLFALILLSFAQNAVRPASWDKKDTVCACTHCLWRHLRLLRFSNFCAYKVIMIILVGVTEQGFIHYHCQPPINIPLLLGNLRSSRDVQFTQLSSMWTKTSILPFFPPSIFFPLSQLFIFLSPPYTCFASGYHSAFFFFSLC